MHPLMNDILSFLLQQQTKSSDPSVHAQASQLLGKMNEINEASRKREETLNAERATALLEKFRLQEQRYDLVPAPGKIMLTWDAASGDIAEDTRSMATPAKELQEQGAVIQRCIDQAIGKED
jgi:hypothetical protein